MSSTIPDSNKNPPNNRRSNHRSSPTGTRTDCQVQQRGHLPMDFNENCHNYKCNCSLCPCNAINNVFCCMLDNNGNFDVCHDKDDFDFDNV
mmetsp:Transcript_1000/g.1924  ORF Transcript_1000/g.1924 Transcript_1000/m.1924 type:complete len:91 (-) Transcript_1000:330-602(-)